MYNQVTKTLFVEDNGWSSRGNVIHFHDFSRMSCSFQPTEAAMSRLRRIRAEISEHDSVQRYSTEVEPSGLG